MTVGVNNLRRLLVNHWLNDVRAFSTYKSAFIIIFTLVTLRGEKKASWNLLACMCFFFKGFMKSLEAGDPEGISQAKEQIFLSCTFKIQEANKLVFKGVTGLV